MTMGWWWQPASFGKRVTRYHLQYCTTILACGVLSTMADCIKGQLPGPLQCCCGPCVPTTHQPNRTRSGRAAAAVVTTKDLT